MSEEHKKRVMAILDRVAQKDLREIDKLQGKTKVRKNEKPEKQVEKACLEWMRNQGWHVQVIEAKATFDPRRNVWRNQSVMAGTSDVLGTTATGISVAVEFKAKGKLKTFRRDANQRQIDFIQEKIEHGAFACVVDSVERLKDIFESWERLRESDIKLGIKFLIGMLP